MIKPAIKRITTRGFRSSLRKVQKEWAVLRAHRRGLRRASRYRGKRGLKLHLGCGPNLKAGWVNIDPFQPDADLTLDLREPLPLDTDSVEVIHSEHFLEHLGYREPVRQFLTECLRVLEPEGLFSVGVPDTGPPLEAYVTGEGEWLSSVKRIHPPECRTVMDHINHHFRQGEEHLMAYDEETLILLLQDVGFVNPHRRDFRPDLDRERRRDSLWVDAFKPVP
jgi:predicted SAM-dependent methyltransferase